MNKQTILIVDDDKTNLEFLSSILSNQYDVKVSSNGEKALKIIEKKDIDLILLDVHMPEMSGYDVAEKLISNENFSKIPFIFLTSDTDKESVNKGLNFGAKDYLTKPFNITELQIKVKNHLLSYKYQKDLESLKQELENDKKKLEKQHKFITDILDNQPNMVILSNGVETEFANKTLLEFFKCKNYNEFKEKFKSITNTFIEGDKYFHLGKIENEKNWIQEILKLPTEKRIVSIYSIEEQNQKIFKIKTSKYDEEKNSFVVTFSDISENFYKQLELEEQTIRDKLTGAYNREYFDKNIEKILFMNKLQFANLGIAILDIDHFKKINDTYGHDVGDMVLKDLVKLINDNTRFSKDILIRWGGEEFVMILTVKDDDSLLKVLENLRKIIEEYNFNVVNKITCSFGCTVYDSKDTIERNIKKADIALYKSKENGRNQVNIFEIK